jgi:hypothetical protein
MFTANAITDKQSDDSVFGVINAINPIANQSDDIEKYQNEMNKLMQEKKYNKNDYIILIDFSDVMQNIGIGLENKALIENFKTIPEQDRYICKLKNETLKNELSKEKPNQKIISQNLAECGNIDLPKDKANITIMFAYGFSPGIPNSKYINKLKSQSEPSKEDYEKLAMINLDEATLVKMNIDNFANTLHNIIKELNIKNDLSSIDLDFFLISCGVGEKSASYYYDKKGEIVVGKNSFADEVAKALSKKIKLDHRLDLKIKNITVTGSKASKNYNSHPKDIVNRTKNSNVKFPADFFTVATNILPNSSFYATPISEQAIFAEYQGYYPEEQMQYVINKINNNQELDKTRVNNKHYNELVSDENKNKLDNSHYGTEPSMIGKGSDYFVSIKVNTVKPAPKRDVSNLMVI